MNCSQSCRIDSISISFVSVNMHHPASVLHFRGCRCFWPEGDTWVGDRPMDFRQQEREFDLIRVTKGVEK